MMLTGVAACQPKVIIDLAGLAPAAWQRWPVYEVPRTSQHQAITVNAGDRVAPDPGGTADSGRAETKEPQRCTDH